MIKAVSLSLCFLLLCAASSQAQTSPTDTAISEAVLRQANVIVLHQTLVEAKHTAARGDLAGAAKKYQECFDLTQLIGAGVKTETAQAVAGLASTRLALARQDQNRGEYHNADVEVGQVLKADPRNSAALAFKKDNDHRMQLMAGKMPDASTVEQIPVVAKAKENSGTMVQDGKLFYEMGKLDEADAKLKEALVLDPDNQSAFYYLNLVKQARYSRESLQHTEDTQARMNQVEKTWVMPKNTSTLPEIGNPYATNTDIYTGAGRTLIMEKLDRIHLDNVSYDGLPLSEVLRDLQAKAQSRDPEKRVINFIIDQNADNSGQSPAPPAGGGQAGGLGGGGGGGGLPGEFGGGLPGQQAVPNAVDPTTGFSPANNAAAAEPVDIAADVLIKLNLSDVRLADVLDAIITVANKPIKYSIRDYAIIFQSRDTRYEPPTLVVRTFKVDPNTFYSGLESVTAQNFGSPGSSGGSSGGGGGSSGGGGGGSSGSSGNNNSSGGVVGVVDAVPGASGARSSGGSSGGGGGGGGRGGGGGGGNTGGGGGGGGSNPLDRGGVPPTSGGAGGGLKYITRLDLTADVSMAARQFFTTLGVNLLYPKSVFFNDRLGLLVVRATEQDLDTIEQALQALNRVAPQVHIKARFIEVSQTDSKALGFDWYLGNFVNGSVIANGGSAGSLATGSSSAANPLGVFPGTSAANEISPAATDQSLTSGLRNSLNAPALATVTGIMTDPNFRVAIRALQQRSGVETLAEPEVVTTSGRQTQMKATQLKTVITDYNFQQGTSATTSGTGGGTIP